jgi:capsular exopolysaccharide synthesis family protein
METTRYLGALVRSWWLIVVTFLAGGLGGLLVAHHATPMYRSSVRLIVSSVQGGSPADQVTLRALAVQRAATYAHIAAQPPAVADAAAAAGYGSYRPSVTATASGTDPFLTVSVEDSSPERAQAIARAYIDTLQGTVARLEGQDKLPVRPAVLAEPGLPGSPFSPNTEREVILGLAAGLVLGIALALLRESLNRSIRDSDELQRLVDRPVLGTVPRDLPKKRLPASTDPRSSRAEAYRHIRTTLINLSPRRPMVIAVTSATVGEGKTSVATNVAVVFSRAGHRTALIDADLRRPQVADFFGITSPIGLTDVLSGGTTLGAALNLMDDGRLAVLTSGRIPGNPSELLDSEAMEDVLGTLAETFEYVIIDTPPVLPVTDALVLAPKVHGVVLVARIGKTTPARVEHAKAAIERVKGTILGVVPNLSTKGADRDYSYPYRYAASRRRGESPDSLSVDDLVASTEPPALPHNRRHTDAINEEMHPAEDGRS